jgi:hypothetical protein
MYLLYTYLFILLTILLKQIEEIAKKHPLHRKAEGVLCQLNELGFRWGKVGGKLGTVWYTVVHDGTKVFAIVLPRFCHCFTVKEVALPVTPC